eukprot:scaffold115537_cov51-Phaeocystis_antarctica.AAC.3
MASEVKLPKREEKATTSAWLAGLAMRKKARSCSGLGCGVGDAEEGALLVVARGGVEADAEDDEHDADRVEAGARLVRVGV